MPRGSRRAQRAREGHRELDYSALESMPRHIDAGDGEWVVRRVSSGTKDYHCPGCGQVVPTGSTHVVAWPADSWFGPEDALGQRRHWHTGCWNARERRR